MARAAVQGNIVVAGPDGVMALSRWANATLWNACGRARHILLEYSTS